MEDKNFELFCSLFMAAMVFFDTKKPPYGSYAHDKQEEFWVRQSKLLWDGVRDVRIGDNSLVTNSLVCEAYKAITGEYPPNEPRQYYRED